MNAIAFDTHAAANTLEDAGFTKARVEALVEITRRTSALPDISALATKDDLVLMRSDISLLKAELRAEMSADKVQIITVVVSAMTVLTAVGAFIGKLIH